VEERRLHEWETIRGCRGIGLAPLQAMCCNAFLLPFEYSGVVALMSQSNRTVLN
jgi:hypothetical protein